MLLFSPMKGRWRIILDPITMGARWVGRRVADYLSRVKVVAALLFLFTAIAAVGGGITIYEFFWMKLPEAKKRAAMEAKRPVLLISHYFVHDTSGVDYLRFDVTNEGNSDAAAGFQPHALVPVDVPIEAPTGVKNVEVTGTMYFDVTDKPYPYAFHPSALYQIALLKLKKEEAMKPFHVLWYITSKTDGTFPGSQKDGTPQYGRIEIEYLPR